MAKASILYIALYFYISFFIANYETAKWRNRLKIDYIKSTTRKPQPIFNYTRHVVELQFHDKEYSRNQSKYIPGAGVIIGPRFIITAAHLVKRGDVYKITVHHPKCGGKTLGRATYAEMHREYAGKPPHYDIGVLLVESVDHWHGDVRLSLNELCGGLQPASLPKAFLAYNFGGRAILIGHEHYYEHFYFTSRRTRSHRSTRSTTRDIRYYSSSEYYSDSEVEDSTPCCSTPKAMRLLRRRVVENVIRIQHCPVDIDGYFFCSYEQNKTIPNEADYGTGVIDRFDRLIGILSYQRFVTYGSNVNFYVDIAAARNWINAIMDYMLKLEKRDDDNTKIDTFDPSNQSLRIGSGNIHL